MGDPEIYVVLCPDPDRDGVEEDNKSAKCVSVPLSTECSIFSCPTCGQEFAKRAYLVRHIKATHGQSVTPVKTKVSDLVGKCPYCSCRFPKRIDLLFHLAQSHEDDEVVIFDMTFEDANSFNHWFEEVKLVYHTSFASHSAKVLRDGTKTKMYNCNRDTQANGRKVRKMFTRATSDYCTAHLFVRESPSGQISVLGSPSHLNHEVNASLVTKPNLPMACTAAGYRRLPKCEENPANARVRKLVAELGALVERMNTYLNMKPQRDDSPQRIHALLVKLVKAEGNMAEASLAAPAGQANEASAAEQRLAEQQRVYLTAVVNLQMDSLVKDLNRIRFAFVETGSVRFEHFAAAFRRLRASMLFQGFDNELSARVFVEDVFEVLVRELEDSESFPDKAFIIYMLYATYFTQACKPRTPIRVRKADLQRLEALVDLCQQDNHLDLVFAVRRLQAESAFHFVHWLRPFAFRSYLLDPQQLTHRKLKLANKIAGHRNLLQTTDLFRRLEFVHDKYCELKVSLGLTTSESESEETNPFPVMRDKIRSVPSKDEAGRKPEPKQESATRDDRNNGGNEGISSSPLSTTETSERHHDHFT